MFRQRKWEVCCIEKQLKFLGGVFHNFSHILVIKPYTQFRHNSTKTPDDADFGGVLYVDMKYLPIKLKTNFFPFDTLSKYVDGTFYYRSCKEV